MMANGYDSWHDSDEIDSDDEIEAYSLLYYDKTEEKKDVENLEISDKLESSSDNEDISVNLAKFNDLEPERVICLSDTEDISINLSNANVKNVICIDSDSDSEKCIPTINCFNANSALYIGSSSDDSDYEAMQISSNSKETSMIINVSNPNTNKIDKLFFGQKQTNANWSVDFKPVPKSKFNNRYFETSLHSVCTICTKKGHSEEQCTRCGPVCILCGKEGHVSKKCEYGVCFICFSNDHKTKNCTHSQKFLRTSCKRCGMRGHSDEYCPDVWRQYKYTTKSGAPLLKTCSSQSKSSVFCANCGKSGHFTEQCSRSRMNSQFLGPPPIMEIIKYDDFDIYEQSGFTYSFGRNRISSEKSDTGSIEFPSFIEKMDITRIVEATETEDMESDVPMMDSDLSVTELHNSQFGDGCIMLSPISKPTPTIKKTANSQMNRSVTFVDTSTPRVVKSNMNQNQDSSSELIPKTPVRLPGITTVLLKKLFPEETANLDKLPPILRKKLRKKLKNFIENGYIPADLSLTQERMEFWLQEISTGRMLNYREKKKLLGSVSAALHSISDRVSSVDKLEYTADIQTNPGNFEEPSSSMSYPEVRKQRNKISRTEKNLKNELKISKKEKRARIKQNKEENSIKTRLRNNTKSLTDVEKRPKLKPNKKKKRKSSEIIFL